MWVALYVSYIPHYDVIVITIVPSGQYAYVLLTPTPLQSIQYLIYDLIHIRIHLNYHTSLLIIIAQYI